MIRPASVEDGCRSMQNALKFCEVNKLRTNPTHAALQNGVQLLLDAMWFESTIGIYYDTDSMVQIGFNHIVPEVFKYLTDPAACANDMVATEEHDGQFLSIMADLQGACETCDAQSSSDEVTKKLCTNMRLLNNDVRVKHALQLLYMSSVKTRVLFRRMFPMLSDALRDGTNMSS